MSIVRVSKKETNRNIFISPEEPLLKPKNPGQGDPCSAPRYMIGSDPSLRALQIVSEAFRYVYRDSGKKMPVIAYADDTFKGLNCVDPQQIRDILQVFKYQA
jgi:hypothetical protein